MPSPLDRIGRYASEERSIQEQHVTFIVEELRDDSCHPCTIDDVARFLAMAPASDWAGIKTIVFRQPTRKQLVLNPSWGRLRYSGTVVTAQRRTIATGPMILLDAIDANMRIDWPSSLDPEDRAELDRLQADGHAVERIGARYRISITPDSARCTQLYRTMPHEIGHWFDWLTKVEEPAQRGEEFEELMARYFARPTSERERFAHRYASELHDRLIRLGLIPFA